MKKILLGLLLILSNAAFAQNSSQCGFINNGDQSAFCRGVTGR